MKCPIKITLNNKTEIIINEEQICAIIPTEKGCAMIHMSDGNSYICVKPSYEAWMNDIFLRKDA